MNLPVALFLSIFIVDTAQIMSTKSQMRFETIEQCENFILYMSEGYPYHRNEQGALVLTNPANENIITAKCYKD